MKILLICLIITPLAYAQDLTQNLRGRVLEEILGTGIPGVRVRLIHNNDTLNTITDINGNFSFKQIPIGRYDLLATQIGYEDKGISNVLLSAGKELVLEVKMTEVVSAMKALEVTANRRKGEVSNDMATVSARSFSIEEASRYAGSFNDPGRMVQSFAGVSSNNDGTNEIVIRGNSPRGVLWRMEGIEIPNPNHYAEQGSSGGAISMLNSSVVSNSDFFTGAFPGEYGNATSGVFDVKLRKGNNQKREYGVQAGLLGVEASLEGPFKKSYAGSYLLNYRYSTIAMLNKLGVDIAGDAVPVFQDLSYKIHLPTKKAGTFGLFGLGGISSILEEYDDYTYDFTQYLGVGGLTHSYMLGKKTVLKSVFAVTATSNRAEEEEADSTGSFYEDYKQNMVNTTYRGSVGMIHKFNSKHTVKVGVIHGILGYNIKSSDYDPENKSRITYINSNGSTGLFQSYVSHKYRASEKLSFTGGLHNTWFVLNGTTSLEPRLGARYQITPNQSVNAGFGVHSKLEDLSVYFAETSNQGNTVYPNKGLGFTRARHYVLGYDVMFNPNLHARVETYYQKLSGVPIIDDPTSRFSALNFTDGWTTDSLANKGTGENYGVEFTLEKYFSDSYYFMVTGSVFNSTYIAGDGIERNTRFNGNYASNYVFGKEFYLGKNGKNNILALNTRINWAGGRRITPILLDESIAAGHTVHDEDRLFEDKAKDYFRLDFQASYRRNKGKTTRIIKLDIQNVLNRENVWDYYYNPNTKTIEASTQLGLLPVLSYQLVF